MFCRKCGKTIPNDSAFCSHCGELVTAEDQLKSEQEIKDNPCSLEQDDKNGVTFLQSGGTNTSEKLTPTAMPKLKRGYLAAVLVCIALLAVIGIISSMPQSPPTAGNVAAYSTVNAESTAESLKPEAGAKAEGYDVNEFSSASDNVATSDSALIAHSQLYMQTRFSNFKDCVFELGTTVQSLDHCEYQINGKMKDKNSTEHLITEILQIFPNESDYLVCLLKVDDQTLVVNQPKNKSEVPNSNPSTGINESLGSYGSTDVSVNETVNYILTISDTEKLPLNGVTMRIECSSPNVIVKNNSDIENPIVKKGSSSFTWDLTDKPNSNQSTVKNIYLSSSVPGDYSVKFYFLTSDGSKSFNGSDGNPTEEEANFSVFATPAEAQKANEKALTNLAESPN